MIYETGKKIIKPWGYEIWLTPEKNFPYSLKKIFFKAGTRCSLQVHAQKIETTYVLNGKGKLLYSKDVFDINSFLTNGMDSTNLALYESELQVLELEPGITFTINSGIVHRVIAIDDLEIIEASTIQLDDVIRLHDDNNRKHGRIESEHKNE